MSEPLTLPQALAALSPAPRLVVLMCGVAGSGKTSLSQALEAKGFRRLSIDEEIWDRFGRYGVDYRPEDYGRHVAAATVGEAARASGFGTVGNAVGHAGRLGHRPLRRNGPARPPGLSGPSPTARSAHRSGSATPTPAAPC